MTYEGACHCGAVAFRVHGSEAITSAVRCNCSICVRRGSIMSARYYPPAEFELVAGADVLALYQWGDREVQFWFCPRCAIHVFHNATARPGHYRVNLGCIAALDVLALPTSLIDGRSF
jgi:hypothetical protein